MNYFSRVTYKRADDTIGDVYGEDSTLPAMLAYISEYTVTNLSSRQFEVLSISIQTTPFN